MSLSIDIRPERDFNGDSNLRSKWNCSYLPTIFQMQRSDYPISSITGNTIPDQLVITVPDIYVIPIVIGDIIYINARYYTGNVTVENLTGGSGSDYIITVSGLIFIGNSLGGYLNFSSRRNYYATVGVMLYNRTTGIYEQAGSLRLAPDNAGLIIADVSGLLNKYIIHQNDLLTVRQDLNVNAGSNYYITTQEHWIGSDELPYSDSSNIYYFTPSVKQLGAAYGNNLADYVPFSVDTVGQVKAKWLTDFERPSWFVGRDVDFSVIISESLAGNLITLEQEYQNAAETAIGAIDADLDTSLGAGVYRVAPIGAVAGDDPLVAGTKFIDLWLEVGGISQQRYVQEDYVDDDYAEAVPPVVTPITPYRVTERQKVKVKSPCEGSLFRWKNSLGGWDRWVFSPKYYSGVEATPQGSRNIYNRDVEDAYSTGELIQKASRKPIKVYTRIEQDDVTGFISLFDSPVVQIYDEQLSKYLTVELQTKGFQFNNYQSLIPIELVFTMPERNTIRP